MYAWVDCCRLNCMDLCVCMHVHAHIQIHTYMLTCIQNVIPDKISLKQGKHVIIDEKKTNMAAK